MQIFLGVTTHRSNGQRSSGASKQLRAQAVVTVEVPVLVADVESVTGVAVAVVVWVDVTVVIVCERVDVAVELAVLV
jgi:hypothetical protein